MKLNNLIEAEQPANWENEPFPANKQAIRKKMLSCQHQADVLLRKFETWAKNVPGTVFVVTGSKQSLPIPKGIYSHGRTFRNFDTFFMVHANPNIATKVFVEKNNPKIVLPIRQLVQRHNDLMNLSAQYEAELNRL